MSTVVQKVNNRSKSKSIREKSIQNSVDAKCCRLNSGHPIRHKFETETGDDLLPPQTLEQVKN
jgi:hypothetical protein